MTAIPIYFVSLGMVILDELRLPNGDVRYDCIGGSGAYSTLGARLATPPKDAENIGMFILGGHDFPDEIRELLRSWNIAVHADLDKKKESTRGLLEYHDEAFGRKSFRYVTKPLQPTPRCLPPHFISSSSFHLLLPPEGVIAQVKELLHLRKENGVRYEAQQQPLLVWEPFPGRCFKEHLEAHIASCREVHVFSPNHLELLALCDKPTVPFDPGVVKECADTVYQASMTEQLKSPQSPHPRAVVVRAGEHGCLVVSDKVCVWLPPLLDPANVVDATGGGNTFLGAFTIALQRSGDLLEAAIQGSVAASFAIEQIGFPERTLNSGSGVKDNNERWNNSSVTGRMTQYRRRIAKKLQNSG